MHIKVIHRRVKVAVVVCVLLAACSVEDTDPTSGTLTDGVTTSTNVINPQEGGAVSTPSTMATTSTVTPSSTPASS